MFINLGKFFFTIILSYILFAEQIGNSTLGNVALHKKEIIIPHNSSTKKISKILLDNQIISNTKIFILCDYIFKTLFRLKLKSGEYLFSQNEGVISSLKKIYEGKSIIRKIIIPEGYSVINIKKLLNNNQYLQGEIKEEIKEGSIFPSTYYYFYGTDRNILIKQMTNKMLSVLETLKPEINFNGPIKNTKELLILASIVEKEAKYDDDKPIIASILIQRLKIKMRLQLDTTLIYHISQGTNEFNRNLTFNDLKMDSKFNSYRSLGLPPTAISCPGLAALRSVINPAKTDYLYFLATPEGKIIYNKTFKEHVISKNLQKNLKKKNIEE